MIQSPKRYFLDAPKEQPGTCFVLNSEYVELQAEVERLTALIEEACKLLCEAPLVEHDKTPTEAGCNVCNWQHDMQDWYHRAIPPHGARNG